MSKLYKREGRRFVEIPDFTGMYYNEDGTFSKGRMSDSIAKCVLQTPSYRLMHALDAIRGVSWYDAKEQCKAFLGCGYLPSRLELCYIKMERSLMYIWSADEYSPYFAWCWSWDRTSSSAHFLYNYKYHVSQFYYVLPFAKLPI